MVKALSLPKVVLVPVYSFLYLTKRCNFSSFIENLCLLEFVTSRITFYFGKNPHFEFSVLRIYQPIGEPPFDAKLGSTRYMTDL